MGHHPGLGRPGIVRADEQQRIRPGSLGLACPVNAVGRVVGADAGHHPDPVLRLRRHGTDEPGCLSFGQGGRLTGGTANDDAIAPCGQQVADEAREPGLADRAVGVHRGHHGDKVGAEEQVSGLLRVGHGSILPRPDRRNLAMLSRQYCVACLHD